MYSPLAHLESLRLLDRDHWQIVHVELCHWTIPSFHRSQAIVRFQSIPFDSSADAKRTKQAANERDALGMQPAKQRGDRCSISQLDLKLGIQL